MHEVDKSTAEPSDDQYVSAAKAYPGKGNTKRCPISSRPPRDLLLSGLTTFGYKKEE